MVPATQRGRLSSQRRWVRDIVTRSPTRSSKAERLDHLSFAEAAAECFDAQRPFGVHLRGPCLLDQDLLRQRPTRGSPCDSAHVALRDLARPLLAEARPGTRYPSEFRRVTLVRRQWAWDADQRRPGPGDVAADVARRWKGRSVREVSRQLSRTEGSICSASCLDSASRGGYEILAPEGGWWSWRSRGPLPSPQRLEHVSSGGRCRLASTGESLNARARGQLGPPVELLQRRNREDLDRVEADAVKVVLPDQAGA